MTQDNIHLNNVLTNPLWYHINTLHQNDKIQVADNLRNHANTFDGYAKKNMQSKYESVISYMNTEPKADITETRTKFQDVTKKLDQIRNENFQDTFPELIGYIQ